MCRSLLQKLKDEQGTAVRNQQYPATSCPICFEDLAKPDAAAGVPFADSQTDLAGAYRHQQSDNELGASSSKSDAATSAPPLAGPEYESLLGNDGERPSVHQDEHKLVRWVKKQC